MMLGAASWGKREPLTQRKPPAVYWSFTIAAHPIYAYGLVTPCIIEDDFRFVSVCRVLFVNAVANIEPVFQYDLILQLISLLHCTRTQSVGVNL